MRLLPRLPATSIPRFIVPSITRCRRQFLPKMFQIQLAFLLLISFRIFLCSLTLSNIYIYIYSIYVCVFYLKTESEPGYEALWVIKKSESLVDCVWNVMAHAQKPDFVFRRNGRVRLNRRGRQFSRLLATEVCASAVLMLDTPYSEVVWRVLATHSINFPFTSPPCVTVCHGISTGLYNPSRNYFSHLSNVNQ